ncbi:MAG: multiheme c-type cytochrome [Candidatus Thiodiazotropha sp.]
MTRRTELTLALVLTVSLLGGLWYSSDYHPDDYHPDTHRNDPDTHRNAAIDEFLDRHWQRPIAPQGDLPSGFTGQEGALAPAECGSCHPQQWRDWRTSLHSRAVGAGLMWQLHLMDQAQANQCLDCHAPLAEQKALLALHFDWPGAPPRPPPAYVDEGLALQGLVCAACHVRKHRRFGPEPRTEPAGGRQPHGGFIAQKAFSDSRFCAACHQFPQQGPRVNGKLQEDTYAQWLASPAAADGRQCQACHMPERRHFWRGIHDPEMVRSGVRAELDVEPVEGRFRITASLSNVDVGHLFPTYMVPKVVMTLNQLLPDGEAIQLGQSTIGWQVNADLNHELADTRIAPGDRHRLQAWIDNASGTVVLNVAVIPREHYERMFQQMLKQSDKLSPAAVEWLETAYAEARAARYDLLSLHKPLPTGGDIAN